MSTYARAVRGALLLISFLNLNQSPGRADLFSLAATGTISFNGTVDATIPVGTPWAFQLTYNTAAPDLDDEISGSHNPEFGRFKNTGTPQALVFFHYLAGSYEVTIDDPAEFGAFSDIIITFTSGAQAIDINIFAPTLFPPLAGGPVSFHADFNAFSPTPIFSSDALPTNTALSPQSFGQSAVTLLPTSSVVTGSEIKTLSLTAVPANADFDDDGDVDGDDLVRWRNGFSTGSARAQGDANGDADVDGNDFLAWQRQLGSAPVAQTAAAVPEPGALAVAVVALAACCAPALRRRK